MVGDFRDRVTTAYCKRQGVSLSSELWDAVSRTDHFTSYKKLDKVKELAQFIIDIESVWDALCETKHYDNYQKTSSEAIPALVRDMLRVLARLEDCSINEVKKRSSGANRRSYIKVSARKRYERALNEFASLCIRQYRDKYGHVVDTPKGRQYYEDFDLNYHRNRIFTPDIDTHRILDVWNQHMGTPHFKNHKSFITHIKRALEATPDHTANEYIRRVLCPDEIARKHSVQIQKTLSEDSSLVDFVDGMRCIRGADATWKTMTWNYNAIFGTHFTTNQLKAKYSRDCRKKSVNEHSIDKETANPFWAELVRSSKSQDDLEHRVNGIISVMESFEQPDESDL